MGWPSLPSRLPLSFVAAQICFKYCMDLDESFMYFGTEYGEEVSLLFPCSYHDDHGLGTTIFPQIRASVSFGSRIRV